MCIWICMCKYGCGFCMLERKRERERERESVYMCVCVCVKTRASRIFCRQSQHKTCDVFKASHLRWQSFNKRKRKRVKCYFLSCWQLHMANKQMRRARFVNNINSNNSNIDNINNNIINLFVFLCYCLIMNKTKIIEKFQIHNYFLPDHTFLRRTKTKYVLLHFNSFFYFSTQTFCWVIWTEICQNNDGLQSLPMCFFIL